MQYPQTYNTAYVNSATMPVYIVKGGDTIINVDSTAAAITIILPNIANSGLLLYPIRLFINDVGNNSATNNITIKPNLDKINNHSSFVISTNGESVDLIPCSNTEWLCNSSNVGTTAPPAWNLLGNAGTDPLLNFVGTTDNQPLIFKINNSLAGQINNANSNVSLGLDALVSNTTGTSNTAVGLNSLYHNTTGNENTAIGISALFNNDNGIGNVAVGNGSLQANTQGLYNTSVGYNTLVNVTIGTFNTAIGNSAGSSINSGSYNTFLGVNADATGSYSNCTSIGYNAAVKADNQMQLGNNLVSVSTNSIATAIEISSGVDYTFDYTISANDTVILNANENCKLPNESLIPDGLEIKIIANGNNSITSTNSYYISSYYVFSTTYTIGAPLSPNTVSAITLKWSLANSIWYVISSNVNS